MVFGRCRAELVEEVTLRYADPPDELGGVLWQIRSPGSTISHFEVGGLPPGFKETVPITARLPSQYLALDVQTDDDRWPITTVGFRLDQLGTTRWLSSTSDNETSPSQVAEMSRRGCIPARGAYA